MRETLFNGIVNDMEEFEIAAVVEEDIPEILRLANEGGLAPWSEEDYRAELKMAGSVVLQIREVRPRKTAGFIVMRLITNSDNSQYSHSEILNITVKNVLRRKHLGSTLIEEAIRISLTLKHSSIWLEVRQSNLAAIAFYENHGFTPEYLRKNLFTDPAEDGWVMKLELQRPIGT